jgi:hypothetical protein
MQRVITLALLSVLTAGQGVMAAQSASDSAVGAWTLNRAKSTFSGAVPYGRVVKFEPAGDAIKETTYTFSTDKPSDVVEYTARFDGNDYPISNSILNTVSLKRVDDETVERTGKIQGQVVETETRTVSDKGKVLTVTTKGTRDGAEYSSVQVYERQPLYTRY